MGFFLLPAAVHAASFVVSLTCTPVSLCSKAGLD